LSGLKDQIEPDVWETTLFQVHCPNEEEGNPIPDAELPGLIERARAERDGVAAGAAPAVPRRGKPPAVAELRYDAEAWFIEDDCPLAPSDRLILLMLIAHYNAEHKGAFPSNRRLAQLTGLNKSTVCRRIEVMGAPGGCLRVRDRGVKRVQHYSFQIPEPKVICTH
jgi:Helix-turn-helix domain